MEKQIVLESNAEYEAFVDKFKPKLTTDDYYRAAGIIKALVISARIKRANDFCRVNPVFCTRPVFYHLVYLRRRGSS